MKSLKARLQSFNLRCFILLAWHHDGQHSGNLDFIFGHCQPDLGRHEVGYLDFILIPAFLIFLRWFLDLLATPATPMKSTSPTLPYINCIGHHLNPQPPQPFDFRPNKWPGHSTCSACPSASAFSTAPGRVPMEWL